MGRPRVVLALSVFVPLVLGVVGAGSAGGEEPRAPTPPEAVETLVNALLARDAAVRPGMAVARAEAATPGAAKHIYERYLPLAGSWLDRDRRFNGIVAWDVDTDKETKVDSVRVILNTGPFDKKAMVRALVAAGKRHGLELEADEEDPDTWFDTGLWISLGRDCVVLEVSPL